MKKYIPLVCLFVFCFACTSDQTKDIGQKEKTPNRHMNESNFETLIEKFEDTSRYTWQKPEIILKKLGNIKGKTIADIGAGSGYFSTLLADRGATVIAMDIDDRFLQFIEDKNIEAVTTKKIPSDDPNLDSNSVDIVLTVNTYHHINDRVAYFEKVLKGLKSDGTLMVVDFKKEDTNHGPPAAMRIAGFSVLKELQEAGFSKVIIDVNSLPEQYIVTAKKRKPRS